MAPRHLTQMAIVTTSVSSVIIAACGSSSPPIPLDAVADSEASVTSLDGIGAPSTSEPSPSTALEFVVGDRWTDATANLTGMESWCGNLAFVSARPDQDEVIASIAGQGLFATTGDSEEWIPYGRSPGSAPLDHRTTSIVYDPLDSDRFWESGFFGLGPPPDPKATAINRTDDGGATFVGLGESAPADLVSVDFGDPDRATLVLGVHGQPRVLRSTDGGETWTDIVGDLPSTIGDGSFPHVIDARTYLLGTHKGEDAGIYRTEDGGTTWVRVLDVAVSGPPLASGDGNLYWVLNDGGIATSSDDGVAWQVLENRAPAGGERSGRIVELEDGTWITLGVQNVIISRDHGASWRSVGPPLPFTPAGFTYAPMRDAVFIWRNYCNVDDDPDPVIAESILRLDLDLDP